MEELTAYLPQAAKVLGIFCSGFFGNRLYQKRRNGNGNDKYVVKSDCDTIHALLNQANTTATNTLTEIRQENQRNYEQLRKENTRNVETLHEKVNEFGLKTIEALTIAKEHTKNK